MFCTLLDIFTRNVYLTKSKHKDSTEAIWFFTILKNKNPIQFLYINKLIFLKMVSKVFYRRTRIKVNYTIYNRTVTHYVDFEIATRYALRRGAHFHRE